jgi:hypothetical protein
MRARPQPGPPRPPGSPTTRPTLAIHQLPVIDTLVLSPICFPENPSHRLVKDYKLVRESINDPVADARQAGALFADEYQSLEGLRRTEPRLFEILHFLLTFYLDYSEEGQGIRGLVKVHGGEWEALALGCFGSENTGEPTIPSKITGNGEMDFL